MENILTKTLGEVLTPRYSEELRDSFDTGYIPSAEFENNMRELIRKTDRPAIFRYTKYLAAAACAVIAIGAAIIVPMLMNNRIEVEPVNTSATEQSGVSITEVSETTSVTTSGTVSAPEDDAAVVIDDSDDTGEVNVVDIISETDTTTNSGQEPGIPSVEIGTLTSGSGTSDPGISQTDDDVYTAEDSDDDIVSNDNDSDDDTTAEDDVVEDDDSSYDYDDDDDVAIEGDDDIVLDDDDAADIPEKVIEVQNGVTLSEIFSQEFGENSFDAFNAYSAYYTYDDADNGVYKHISFNFSDNDNTFIQDFVHKLGNAKAGEDTLLNPPSESITINVNNFSYILRDITPRYYNYSAWKHYSTFFNSNGDMEIDEDDSDDTIIEDSDKRNMNFSVIVWRQNCMVTVTDNFNVEGADCRYILNNSFYMDKADVEALFTAALKTVMPDDVKSVGQVSEAMGITSDNIKYSYANIHSVYDTDLDYGRIGSDYITGLFSRYSGKELERIDTASFNQCVAIKIITKDDADLQVLICPDNTIVIKDYITWYKFKGKSGEFDKALDAVSSANGITIPRYTTLGEYLSDKNFTALTHVNYMQHDNGKVTYFTLDNKDDLKKLTDMLKSEFETAKYVPIPGVTSDTNKIDLTVSGYFFTLILAENDRLFIRTTQSNCFQLSAGFTEKFRKAFMECEGLKKSEESLDDSDEYDDDVDDITIEIDDDQNPIT